PLPIRSDRFTPVGRKSKPSKAPRVMARRPLCKQLNVTTPMKARRPFRAPLRVLVLLAFGILMPAVSIFAITVTHEFPMPGGGKMTVTTVGPKGGETDHLTWSQTDKDG